MQYEAAIQWCSLKYIFKENRKNPEEVTVEKFIF